MQPILLLSLVLACCRAFCVSVGDELLQGLVHDGSGHLPGVVEAAETKSSCTFGCNAQSARRQQQLHGVNRCACAEDSLKTLRRLLLAGFPGTVPSDSYASASRAAMTRLRGVPLAQAAAEDAEDEQLQLLLNAELNDERLRKLYAWLVRAFAGDEGYDDLQYSFIGAFSNYVPSFVQERLSQAVDKLPTSEDVPTGEIISMVQRESNSMGAMGAGQWQGAYYTRPHSLLDIRPYASIDEWVQGLKRKDRATLRSALKENWTVTTKEITGDSPAPHSTFAHFRCVVEHEVRLLKYSPGSFFNAVQQAIFRYRGCTSQTGEIHEYRDENGTLIAFSHEVRKGRVIRGQWFYASDAASRRYVWFHSVQELARRAIEADNVDFADLGPSGSDAFEDLKKKYGFVLYRDWHVVADYNGAFRYGNESQSLVKDTLQRLRETFMINPLAVLPALFIAFLIATFSVSVLR